MDSAGSRRPTYVGGLIVGFALTCALAAILFVGFALGLPFIPFDVFDWVTRILPGRLVIFGVETMSSLLQTLGFNIKDTAKTTEHMMAVAGFLATGAVVGLVFFAIVRAVDRSRTWLYGIAAGVLFSIPIMIIVLTMNTSSTAPGSLIVIWILATFAAWGAVLGWSRTRLGAGETGEVVPARPVESAAPGAPEGRRGPAESAAAGPAETTGPPPRRVVLVDRRRFLVQLGGATAAITLVGAGLGAVLRTSEQQTAGAGNKPPPIPFPNADSTVEPVPGTRPEYTPVADHYRIDINAVPRASTAVRGD